MTLEDKLDQLEHRIDRIEQGDTPTAQLQERIDYLEGLLNKVIHVPKIPRASKKNGKQITLKNVV